MPGYHHSEGILDMESTLPAADPTMLGDSLVGSELLNHNMFSMFTEELQAAEDGALGSFEFYEDTAVNTMPFPGLSNGVIDPALAVPDLTSSASPSVSGSSPVDLDVGFHGPTTPTPHNWLFTEPLDGFMPSNIASSATAGYNGHSLSSDLYQPPYLRPTRDFMPDQYGYDFTFNRPTLNTQESWQAPGHTFMQYPSEPAPGGYHPSQFHTAGSFESNAPSTDDEFGQGYAFPDLAIPTSLTSHPPGGIKKRRVVPRGQRTIVKRPTKSDRVTVQHNDETAALKRRAESGDRQAQNQMLLQDRAAGFTFKQCMERCNYGVTESALRGRYRLLKRGKTACPRQPSWKPSDVGLLIEVMDKHLGNLPEEHRPVRNDHESLRRALERIYWTGVSSDLFRGGASFDFCGTTCKTKYMKMENLA